MLVSSFPFFYQIHKDHPAYVSDEAPFCFSALFHILRIVALERHGAATPTNPHIGLCILNVFSMWTFARACGGSVELGHD
jgi:hypothetical protein